MEADIFKKIVLDTLFPISCLFCGRDDDWVCAPCLERIKILTEQVCPYCEKNITLGGKICRSCQDRFRRKNRIISLDRLIVATKYDQVARLVHFLKYNFISDLSFPLGKILIKSLFQNNCPLPDVIIPIPLHPRRLRWRGFNQSELLADYISENLTPGLPVPVLGNVIYRTRYTKPQMKIKNYHERQENMRNMFDIAGNAYMRSEIKNKNILLIDDIATTGSTLFECAKTLKNHGAKSINASVLARQEIKI